MFASKVADIRLESSSVRETGGVVQVWQLTLDTTLFRPGDTGVLEAVTRSGTRLGIRVLRVLRDDDGVMWHVVEKPLAAGTDVVGRVESDTRMQGFAS